LSDNFHVALGPDMGSARIVNARPLGGEAPVYVSHWNEPAHEAFALILFVPILCAIGHILVVERLDAAGHRLLRSCCFTSKQSN